jgi:ribosomal protein S18 acetylase RimI-like enzyme
MARQPGGSAGGHAMASSLIEIRNATVAEMPQTVSAILAAFLTDPIARYAWPSPHDYFSGMAALARGMGGSSFAHASAYVTPDLCGAALWLPPGVHADGGALEGVLRDTARPEHLHDLLATFEKMDESRPEELHWYLPLLGVEPNAQGRGIGGALMRHAVARCDREGALAYLESSNERNRPLYERHGFEVMGEIKVGAGPLVTPMLRHPR